MDQQCILTNPTRRLYYGRRGVNSFYQTADLQEAVRLTGPKAESILHNSVPRKEHEEWSVVAVSPATCPSETDVSPLGYDWEKTARKLNAFYTDLASTVSSKEQLLPGRIRKSATLRIIWSLSVPVSQMATRQA